MASRKPLRKLEEFYRAEVVEAMDLMFKAFHRLFELERKVERMMWEQVVSECEARVAGQCTLGKEPHPCGEEWCQREDWKRYREDKL